jgi:hypothetical protein
LQLASGGPCFDIDAVNYLPHFNWDKAYQEAMDAPTKGYERYLSFPGDVAFRVAGKSRGHFMGLWIALRFRQALEKAGNTVLKGAPLDSEAKDHAIVAQAVIVSASDLR